MKMKLDPTFDKLAKEAVDKAHEAAQAYYNLKPEDRTPKAANAVVRALKEAGSPLRQYVLVQRMRAKAWKSMKLIGWLERKEDA